MYVSPPLPKKRVFANKQKNRLVSVAFKVYDMDRDGYISNGELFLVLKMMVGNNLKVTAFPVPWSIRSKRNDFFFHWPAGYATPGNCG
jgi:hypothetical protein